jgi:hypothetical protein
MIQPPARKERLKQKSNSSLYIYILSYSKSATIMTPTSPPNLPVNYPAPLLACTEPVGLEVVLEAKFVVDLALLTKTEVVFLPETNTEVLYPAGGVQMVDAFESVAEEPLFPVTLVVLSEIDDEEREVRPEVEA